MSEALHFFMQVPDVGWDSLLDFQMYCPLKGEQIKVKPTVAYSSEGLTLAAVSPKVMEGEAMAGYETSGVDVRAMYCSCFPVSNARKGPLSVCVRPCTSDKS